MRRLIGGSIVTALVLVALGGATLANAATPSTGFAARAASLVTRASTSGPTTSSFATPFASIAPTVNPSISGTPEVDDLLTADPGNWPGTGLVFTYQWFDCDPSDVTSCTAIPSATASTYIVDPADGDSVIVVQVDAADGGGDSGSATSAPTAVVTAQPGAPVELYDPAVGSVVGGRSSTPALGSWSNSPTSYTEAWIACSQDLASCAVDSSDTESSAIALSYTPSISDVGKVLVFAVIASNATGDSVEAVSVPSSPVVFPPPTASISSPGSATYPAGEALWPVYSCNPPAGMSVASCVGTSPINTMFNVAAGSHLFTVTATDTDGQTATATVTYSGLSLSFPPPPSSSTSQGPAPAITSPEDGATVIQGSTLDFAVNGFEPYTAQQQPNPEGGVLASGSQLDTSQLGLHTVTFTTVSTPIVRFGGGPTTPGASQSSTVTYTVVEPPLAVTSLSQSSAKWKPGNALPAAITARAASHAPGTHFSFVANRPATITYTFSRLVAGRAQGRACVAATHANRRAKACTRSLPSEVMTLPAASGANLVSFQGRLNSSARLRPGRYCVTVAAQATSQPTGPAIQVGTLHFTIVK